MSIGYLLGGILFILAGIYQMTPLKDSCLYYCRNPIELFSSNKIFSNWSAFYVGLKHGFFCVGCCWILMLLLFYVGVMNLFWIAGAYEITGPLPMTLSPCNFLFIIGVDVS